MSRRQDGPGGYRSFFPLGHRNSHSEDVSRFENLTQVDRIRINEESTREFLVRNSEKLQMDEMRVKLHDVFGDTPKAIKQIMEVLDLHGCTELILWVQSIKHGMIVPLPSDIAALFRMPLRKITETSFATWFCASYPQEKDAIVEKMRRAACLHLLDKCRANFVNPHSEVLSFVSGLSPFALYEITCTTYQPTAIARLGQLLRQNDRMR